MEGIFSIGRHRKMWALALFWSSLLSNGMGTPGTTTVPSQHEPAQMRMAFRPDPGLPPEPTRNSQFTLYLVDKTGPVSQLSGRATIALPFEFLTRTDVAYGYKVLRYTGSGFLGVLPSTPMPKARHAVRLRIVSSAGRTCHETAELLCDRQPECDPDFEVEA